MQYLSTVYCVTTPLHVSGLLVADHQEVSRYICDNWYVLYVFVNFGGPAEWRLRRATRTNYHVYTLLPPDEGLLASPKHVEV
jgi:hypothetical protein